MANNRMYLICNVCWPEVKDKWPNMQTDDGKAFLHLAKWYPGEVGEWYTNRSEQIGTFIDEFFLSHAHPDKYPGSVENPVRLEYEWVGTPFDRLQKDEI